MQNKSEDNPLKMDSDSNALKRTKELFISIGFFYRYYDQQILLVLSDSLLSSMPSIRRQNANSE